VEVSAHEQLKPTHCCRLALDVVFFLRGKKSILLNYWGNIPFSWRRGGMNWWTAARSQTETGGQRPHFVSPHERCTRRMLSPSILSSSPSLEWAMRYWNHMPSWIPHGSSHPIQSQQSSAGHGHCRKGGLPASWVGSKYLHSPSSRVARSWCFGLCKVQSSRTPI